MIIGPLTWDENIDFDGSRVLAPGGAVYYASAGACAAGLQPVCAVKMQETDAVALEAFVPERKQLFILPSKQTTRMLNVYREANRERRESSCPVQSDPIIPQEIPEEPVELYHFAGLLDGDFDEACWSQLASRAALSADVQGWIRFREGDRLGYRDWKYKRQHLPQLQYLKTDARESQILTGLEDRREAARQLCDWGVGEVLLSYHEAMLLYDGKRFYEVPVRAHNLSGRTGRGDTVMGAYLARRLLGDSPEEALLFATAAVSLKMEKPGCLQCETEDIWRCIRERYSSFEDARGI